MYHRTLTRPETPAAMKLIRDSAGRYNLLPGTSEEVIIDRPFKRRQSKPRQESK
jgi:hypothetical protein